MNPPEVDQIQPPIDIFLLHKVTCKNNLGTFVDQVLSDDNGGPDAQILCNVLIFIMGGLQIILDRTLLVLKIRFLQNLDPLLGLGDNPSAAPILDGITNLCCNSGGEVILIGEQVGSGAQSRPGLDL